MGRHVTIEELRQRECDGVAFVVIDTDTGADVTRELLGQD